MKMITWLCEYLISRVSNKVITEMTKRNGGDFVKVLIHFVAELTLMELTLILKFGFCLP